jgi:hypothetical protein
LPLVVVGIDPGGISTRSATFRPCDLDIAEVTSFLTTLSYMAATRPPVLLHRRLVVLGVVIPPVHDQQILHAAHDEHRTFGGVGRGMWLLAGSLLQQSGKR